MLQMADSILPGTWRLESVKGCNVYLLDLGAVGTAIIDTGVRVRTELATEVDQILESNELGPITYILLTHRHRDHCGGLKQMKKIYPNALVVAGEADCEINDVGELVMNETMIDLPVCSTSGTVSRPVNGIRAIALPGHTQGSLVFISEKNNVTFVGDLVIVHREYLARPLKRVNEDDALYLDSLRLLSDMTTDIGAPGHGYVVSTGFRSRVAELAALPRRAFNFVRLMRGLFAFARLRFNR